MQTNARKLLVLGIVLAVFAAFFVAVIPAVAAMFVTADSPDGQTLYLVVEVIVRFVASLIPPLAAALIAGGLVLRTLGDRSA